MGAAAERGPARRKKRRRALFGHVIATTTTATTLAFTVSRPNSGWKKMGAD